jgi:hypothetical protein
VELDLAIASVTDRTAWRVKLYDNSLRMWTKVKPGLVVTVKEGESVFLKALDVTDCIDFDRYLNATGKNLHIRHHLPQERTYVRQAIKQRHMSTAVDSVLSISSEDDNDLDLETGRASTSKFPITPIAKPSRAPASDDESSSEKKPVVLNVSSDNDNNNDEDSDDSDILLAGAIFSSTSKTHKRKPGSPVVPPVTQRPRLLSGSSSGSSAISNGPGLTPNDAIIIDEATPIWPADFYIVDIVLGFAQCEQARRAHLNVGETFTATFGIPFRKATFYENRKRWEEAPQSSRDKSLAAGRTPAGTWAMFVKNIRLEKSNQLDKAKTKAKASVQRVKQASR